MSTAARAGDACEQRADLRPLPPRLCGVPAGCGSWEGLLKGGCMGPACKAGQLLAQARFMGAQRYPWRRPAWGWRHAEVGGWLARERGSAGRIALRMRAAAGGAAGCCCAAAAAAVHACVTCGPAARARRCARRTLRRCAATSATAWTAWSRTTRASSSACRRARACPPAHALGFGQGGAPGLQAGSLVVPCLHATGGMGRERPRQQPPCRQIRHRHGGCTAPAPPCSPTWNASDAEGSARQATAMLLPTKRAPPEAWAAPHARRTTATSCRRPSARSRCTCWACAPRRTCASTSRSRTPATTTAPSCATACSRCAHPLPCPRGPACRVCRRGLQRA